MEIKFTVPEISCNHCKETIEGILNSEENINSASVDIEKKEVSISSNTKVSIGDLGALLDDHGYTVVEWTKTFNSLSRGNDLCCLCSKNWKGFRKRRLNKKCCC